MHQVPDPYRLLGLGRDATVAEIKAAHRRLAKRYHPDAPQGDAQRFLAVQEAYQLLADPSSRQRWDARQAGGPVRADDPSARARPRGERTRPQGRRGTTTPGAAATGAPGAPPGTDATDRGGSGPSRPPGADPRGQPGGSYTWSARNVPWWESDAPNAARRPPGRQRPHERPPAGTEARQERGAPEGHPFEAYSRSSGAAWSQASRAYFRRAAADLPRGRAGWADRPWTRPDAQAGDAGPDEPAPARPRTGSGGGRGGAASSHRFSSQGPQLGTVRMRASAVQDLRRPWPTPVERIALATAGWLPRALLVTYGGGALTGCDRASVACPPYLEPLQAGLVAGILIALLLLPRLAFLAAVGSVGLAVGALSLLLVFAATGLPQPLPEELTVFTLVCWAAAYLVGIWAAANDWPVARPWLHRPLAARPEGPSWNRRVGITGRPRRGG